MGKPKLSEHTSTGFIGVFLGLVSVALLKIAYPRAVEFHRTAKHLVSNPKDARSFSPDQFAIAVLKRNKEVFDKLAEM